MECKIVKLYYNGIAVKINDKDKILYIQRFPPFKGTTEYPDFSVTTTNTSCDSFLNRETYVNFWLSNDQYQADGTYRGGQFGSDNLPTLSKNWLTDIYIGDTVYISEMFKGIVPYSTKLGKAFDGSENILKDTEQYAGSYNIIYGNNTYSGYVTENPSPQSAIDILFVFKNRISNRRFIKLLKRGSLHPTVDMPEKITPGAGEHREPGSDFTFKLGFLRTVFEELGICLETLLNCYLIEMGKFNDNGRDPRYRHFSAIQNGDLITFGIDRYSETSVYILYIDVDSESDIKEQPQLDTVEIKQSFWSDMSNELLNNPELWMISEHGTYIQKANNLLDEFDKLPQEEKDKHIFTIN
jgi:hypothetical protein